MTTKILYFDTAATTQLAPEVLEAMLKQLESTATFANPSSNMHEPGRAASAVIDNARTEIATEFGCDADEVIFTSGATEANNLALRGVSLANSAHGRHLITSQIEHKATLACCSSLENEGFDVTYLPPDRWGRIDPVSVETAIRPDTLLISLAHINNETGVIQPIDEIATLAAEQGVLLHIDAAQAAGKFRIKLNDFPIDLLSLSAHKFHGPKGAGCLIVRNRRQLRLRPLMYGGGQEFGLRPGTLPTHQIVGMATALSLAAKRRDTDLAQVTDLKHHLLNHLKENLPVQVNGKLEYTSPYILNFSIAGIQSDALINQLADTVAIASGSACSSGTVEPSYVLRAMGVEGDALYGAVRLSFDRNHSRQEVSSAVERIIAVARRMQELALK